MRFSSVVSCLETEAISTPPCGNHMQYWSRGLLNYKYTMFNTEFYIFSNIYLFLVYIYRRINTRNVVTTFLNVQFSDVKRFFAINWDKDSSLFIFSICPVCLWANKVNVDHCNHFISHVHCFIHDVKSWCCSNKRKKLILAPSVWLLMGRPSVSQPEHLHFPKWTSYCRVPTAVWE